MTISVQNVQATLDRAIVDLQKTNSSYPQMVKKYGSDWTKWPATSKWYLAFSEIAAARVGVGSWAPTLAAEFTYKEF